ncbi:MAG: S-methyl-5'-thioadenosine phosphorylase [Pseudomonadota bacterium]
MGSAPRKLAIIGGSGLYDLDGIERVLTREIDTPWGAPSGGIKEGTLGDVEIVFLARHGEGHRIPPSEINYRANIAALKIAGATDIISISACGSFQEHLEPGRFVIVDQFVDRTSGRASSFFGEGCVAHVSIADPVCPTLAEAARQACEAAGVPHHTGGTYISINGPQFSSRAESLLYKSWGCDVIGMTNLPEAKLAREAELPYATIAMVTDYDCWRDGTEAVSVRSVLDVMAENNRNAKALLPHLIDTLGSERQNSPLAIETCLDHAIITPAEKRDPDLVAKLATIAGRVLG